MAFLFAEEAIMFKKLISVLVLFAACSLFAACQNTVQGFGKDLQSGGQAIQKSAS